MNQIKAFSTERFMSVKGTMIKVVELANSNSELRQSLSCFESQFEYPLGEHASFTISHGRDYESFFQAIGEETIFLAVDSDCVIGTLAVVSRSLILDGVESQSFYIADLKVSEKKGKALFYLFEAACKKFKESMQLPQFGIMMQGTGRSPEEYSGRLGFPLFEKLAEIAIIRYPLKNMQSSSYLQSETFFKLKLKITSAACVLPLHEPSLRSRDEPVRFVSDCGKVSGVLEDTLAGKILYSEGKELISGHIGDFKYDTPEDAVKFILAIESEALKKYPALFFAVPMKDKEIFLNKLPEATNAPAIIFGRNLRKDLAWQVNTSEI